MGGRLQEVRQWMGLTLKETGCRIGVSRQRINQLEQADYFSKEQTEKISQTLGIDEKWLRTGNGAMFKPGFEVEKAAKTESVAAKKTRLKRERAEREAIKKVRAKYLRDLRADLMLTQMEFGAAIGIPQNKLSNLEHEKGMVSDVLLKRIETAVNEGRLAPKPRSEIRSAHKIRHGPFITVYRGGIILNAGMMEKLGDSGYITMYTEKGEGRGLLIKAAKEDELGAKKLSHNGSWKIISAEYRKGVKRRWDFR